MFGPGLETTEYVMEYVWKVKNNNARNTFFKEVFNVLANPSSLSDLEIWSIILDVIRNFDFFSADTSSNPLWNIFAQNDIAVQQMTGFMLAHNKSAVSSSMLAVSKLQSVLVVPTASAELLLRILKWIWVPIVVTLNESKANHFESITFEQFNDIIANQINLPTKRSLELHNVNSEVKVRLLYKSGPLPTTDWETFKRFIHNLIEFATRKFGRSLTMEGCIDIDKLLSDTVDFVNVVMADHSDSLNLTTVETSLNEILVSDESIYPNDTSSDSTTSEEDESSTDDEKTQENSDSSLYRLYHPLPL